MTLERDIPTSSRTHAEPFLPLTRCPSIFLKQPKSVIQREHFPYSHILIAYKFLWAFLSLRQNPTNCRLAMNQYTYVHGWHCADKVDHELLSLLVLPPKWYHHTNCWFQRWAPSHQVLGSEVGAITLKSWFQGWAPSHPPPVDIFTTSQLICREISYVWRFTYMRC